LSLAPNAWYGGFSPGDSVFAMKMNLLPEAGVSLNGVLALTVLECQSFHDSPSDWPAKVVPCPRGTSYSQCIANGNDGLGNWILVGVQKSGHATNLGSPVCSTGTRKLDLLIRAGEDPRLISGIVTLNSGPATGTRSVTLVSCQSGPSPYAWCLRTGNDGSGHADTIVVVAANGPTDPFGFYGECGPEYASRCGFWVKSSLVTAAGEKLGKVQGIEYNACAIPASFGYLIPKKSSQGCLYE
jgi:hypothetical protein